MGGLHLEVGTNSVRTNLELVSSSIGSLSTPSEKLKLFELDFFEVASCLNFEVLSQNMRLEVSDFK